MSIESKMMSLQLYILGAGPSPFPEKKTEAELQAAADEEFEQQMLADAMDDPEFRSMRAHGRA